MKKTVILILCLAIVFVVCGCSSVQPEEPAPEPTEEPTSEPTEELTSKSTEESTTEPTEEPAPEPANALSVFGEVQDGVYINEFLGVSAAVPEGWEIASKEELFTMMNIAEGLSKDLESLFEQSAETGTILFLCSKYAMDYEGLNPNIIIAIEDAPWTPDYAKETMGELETLYQQMDETYGWTSEVSIQENIEISGVEYCYAIIETDMDGTMMYQEQLVTGIQDYSLAFSFTYFEDADVDTISVFITSVEYS